MALGVGIIGAGTVGGGVIETLLGNAGVIAEKTGAEVALKHVADLNVEAFNAYDLNGVTIGSDANALINDPEVHVVCELIGGEEPARTFILNALNAKKHVVTANKMLMALHGEELNKAAIDNSVELRYEAAVAGTIPIIKAIRESLASNNIKGIYGILNGTCNYILTRMSLEGLEFSDVLDQAVALGFAETPPDLDVEGYDTAHKCQILASLAYSSPVKFEDIHIEGVTKVTHSDVAYAKEMGYQIKLLAVIRKKDGAIDARVHPTLIPDKHLLNSVKYEFNAVYIESDIADATLYYGRGAGKLPTASAVVSDIVDIATREGAKPLPPFRYSQTLPVRKIGLLQSRYYLRLTTEDHPGVLGKICSILGEHKVSIASCLQKEEGENTPAHVIIMTHISQESDVVAALEAIDQHDFITEASQVLRVL